jgi:hypothetical protein
MFHNQEKNNLFFNGSVNRIFSKIGLHPSPSHYTIRVNEIVFQTWFNQYAASWIYPSHKKIDDYSSTAIWDGYMLKLAGNQPGGMN